MASANNTNNGGSVGGVGVCVSIRDVCNFIQQQQQPVVLSPSATGVEINDCYDRIIEKMRGLDLQDDGILLNHKIKSIESEFCNIVRDETMLCESMEYINDKALNDGDTALKFALLFSSRNFDALAMNDIKVRSAMLKILETNFRHADNYRMQDKERLYNSITLLGEYYHRVRLANNTPITILGKSLLGLLVREISEFELIDVKLAKLILSQITLNGDMMRSKHKAELTQLLYHIRRNLIEQAALKPCVKALLLMTLDLYYSNFTNLGVELETMYTKYLVQDDDEGNNNCNANNNNNNNTNQQHQQPQIYRQSLQQQQQTYSQQQQKKDQQQPKQQDFDQHANSYATLPTADQQNSTTAQTYQELQQQQQQQHQNYETYDNNGESCDKSSTANDSFDVDVPLKKWSEQVLEDSFLESELSNDFNCDNNELNVSGASSGAGTGRQEQQQQQQQQHNNSNYDNSQRSPKNQLDIPSPSSRSDTDRENRNARRSRKPSSSPRPLKQNFNSNESDSHQPSAGEEIDQTKPLPRWRGPRNNQTRDREETAPSSGNNNNNASSHGRFSGKFDEDQQSVRDEGGSIRLYSINDRLKHSQEKIERSISNTYNAIANSNWDRQSQHDDRSERSYRSNYERGNYKRGGRPYNNRQTYDKPPRFQKHNNNNNNPNHHQQQQQQQHHDDRDKIHSDSWRRSYGNASNAMSNSYQDDTVSLRSNGPESNSMDSSSRASTLPRPPKNHMEGGGGYNNRRSQSPYRHGGSNAARPRNFNATRYSSQSSLASEASSTFDRRHNPRKFNRQPGPSQQHQPHHHRDWQQQHHQQQQQQDNAPNKPQRNQGRGKQTDVGVGAGASGGDDSGGWDTKENNSELVRNARQTTKYMNYLSSKK